MKRALIKQKREKSLGSRLDPSSFMGGLTKVFIIISIVAALQVLNISGAIRGSLISIANYLPILLRGIIIIVFDMALIEFLTSLISRVLKPIFPEVKSEVVDMLKNLLLIDFIAVVYTSS